MFNKPNNNNNMKQITLCLLLAVCCLLVPSAMRAQSPANEIVRLHNGTEITGTVERLPNGSVRVTDQAGDMFVFSTDEVASIMTPQQKQERQKKEDRAERRTERGYFGIVEGSTGYSLMGGFAASVGMVNGYKVSPFLYVGVGVDFGTTMISEYIREEYYSGNHSYTSTYWNDYQTLILPIYAHVRYSILGRKRVSPFLAFNAGYDVLGNVGPLLELSTGVEVKSRKGAWWISADVPFYTEEFTMDLRLKVGYSF